MHFLRNQYNKYANCKSQNKYLTFLKRTSTSAIPDIQLTRLLNYGQNKVRVRLELRVRLESYICFRQRIGVLENKHLTETFS